MKTTLAFLFFVLALAFAPSALASYTPPPMTAHVTDTAHKLTEPERIAIDRKLEDYRLRTSNEIAVFIPSTLDGETIEDVANATARAWKLGAKGDKNGLLLVIAPVERKVRIEVAQGNQGALTDLQANDIIRTKIKPRLASGSENYRAAVDDATDAIIATLDKGGATGHAVTTPGSTPHAASGGDLLFGLVFFLFMLAVPIIFMVIIIRAIARAFSSNGRSASSGWASGSSWSNDSSWSSSSNDSSWSSGGGGGSDWGGGGGGGGDSGFSGGGGGGFDGGGSSDSF